jgi:hypothetical protein
MRRHTERDRARMAMREEGAYRVYVTVEQRPKTDAGALEYRRIPVPGD